MISWVVQPAGSAGAVTPSKFSLLVTHGIWHVSPLVQALPSLQAFPDEGTWLQPAAGEHESAVQSFRSSQFTVPDVVHPVGETQTSMVHALPSLQTTGACEQVPFAGAQVSVVQLSLSLQLTGEPGVQVPLTQVSAPLHALPSEHSLSVVHELTMMLRHHPFAKAPVSPPASSTT